MRLLPLKGVFEGLKRVFLIAVVLFVFLAAPVSLVLWETYALSVENVEVQLRACRQNLTASA